MSGFGLLEECREWLEVVGSATGRFTGSEPIQEWLASEREWDMEPTWISVLLNLFFY
jgi:hypothetical protein